MPPFVLARHAHRLAAVGLSRSRLKHLYYLLLQLAGREGALYRRVRDQDLLVVLNLHRVSPEPNPYWSPLHPRLFDALCGFLARRFHVTTFAGLAERSAGDRRLPALVLSFDDGYRDFLDYALPILRKHGLRANQNVVGSCLETGLPVWTVLLSDFLVAAPRTLLGELRLPGFPARHGGDDQEAKRVYGLALSAFLKQRSRAEREPLWSAVRALMDRTSFTATRMMTKADVQAIATECEIGSHSHGHESMGYESDAYFAADFARCRTLFVDELGLPLGVYAFPNGSYRATQLEWLGAQPGLQHVLLVDEKYSAAGEPRRLGGARLHARLTMSSESVPETRFVALGYKSRGVYQGPA